MPDNERSRALAPPPLPNSRQELDRSRRTRRTLTLNDMFEVVYRVLMDVDGAQSDGDRAQRDSYRKYVLAVYDSQAVEGSLSIDNVKAAEIVREYARASNLPEVADLKDQNLATLVKVQGVVLRRYGQDRKSRRLMLGGEVVENDSDE